MFIYIDDVQQGPGDEHQALRDPDGIDAGCSARIMAGHPHGLEAVRHALGTSLAPVPDSDDQDLAAISEFGQPLADSRRDSAANSSIDLVENHRRHWVRLGQDCLNR